MTEPSVTVHRGDPIYHDDWIDAYDAADQDTDTGEN